MQRKRVSVYGLCAKADAYWISGDVKFDKHEFVPKFFRNELGTAGRLILEEFATVGCSIFTACVLDSLFGWLSLLFGRQLAACKTNAYTIL